MCDNGLIHSEVLVIGVRDGAGCNASHPPGDLAVG